MNEMELLLFAASEGIVDLDTVRHQVENMERKKYLEEHKNKIWKGTNGKWYTELPTDGGKRKLVKKTHLEDLEAAIVEHYKSIDYVDTFKKDFEAWLALKLRLKEIGNATVDRYKGQYTRYFEGTEISEMKVEFITEDYLELFIRTRIADLNLTAKAYANMKTLIIGIFKYAKKQGHTSISISEFFGDLSLSRKVFTKTEKKPQVFKRNEVEAITQYLEANPSIYNLGILLAFYTGVRAGELAALKYTDIDEHTLTISRQEIRYKGKDGQMIHEVVDYTKTEAGSRQIMITAKAREIIEEIRILNPDGEYLFMIGDRRLHKQLFTDWIYKACDAVGIERRSLHKVRKTYGTRLIDSGADDSFVMAQMGHADIMTTRQHYYFSDKGEKDKLQQLQKAIDF